MRAQADIDFIRDRVLAEIAANPSRRPYLGERGPTCRLGHSEFVPRDGGMRCLVCERERGRQRRERKEPTS